MGRRTPRQPVLSSTEIEYLLEVTKYVPDGWRDRLLPPVPTPLDRSTRLQLDDLPAGMVRGRLHIYARESLAQAPGDWSVGLVYTDYDGNRYPLVRCNGPHENVHLLTERYERIDKFNSGFAIPADFTSAAEALDTLRDMGHLAINGSLFAA